MANQLRVFFFPFLSPGDMIPCLDTATLFARRGVTVTIVTTPGNEPFVRPTLLHPTAASSNPIDLLLISFPSTVHHHLPSDGKENLSSAPFTSFSDFFHASSSLQQPLLDLLRLHRPDCLVFDVNYHWAADIAQDLSIPCLVFRCPGLFPLCVENSLELTHTPFQNTDTFVIQGLPHRIELGRSEIPESFLVPGLQELRRESEKKSLGIIVNSFYELEAEYDHLFRKDPRRRAWFVGPVSLSQYNGSDGDHKIARGIYSNGSSDDNDVEWLKWLESKPESSVLYVCFGSLWEFSNKQLDEIAAALEAAGYPFIWVVKKSEEWQPPELNNKGLVITKWAPQLRILNHPAVGGFMMHCGWNSVLEGVAASLPLIGWPLMYEQFINERFTVEVLKIGVKVQREGGNALLGRLEGKEEVVGREEIRRAIENVMGGNEEATEMRKRAKEYKEKARKAMDEGGSSFEDLNILIQELKAKKEHEEIMVTGLATSSEY